MGVHQGDEFAEAFLPAGKGTVVGGLAGRPVGAGPPTEFVGGGGFPGLSFVYEIVRILLRHGIAEMPAERLAAQRPVFLPKQVADLMHGKPVADEGIRVVADGEPEGSILDQGPSHTLIGLVQPEVREADAAGLEIADRLFRCGK